MMENKDKNKHDHDCCGKHEHHHEDHDCNCQDHHHEHMEDEFPVLKLELDNGEEVEALVLADFEIEDKKYITLLVQEEEMAYLYEYEEGENGIELISIKDDEEFERASEVYEGIMKEKHDHKDQ